MGSLNRWLHKVKPAVIGQSMTYREINSDIENGGGWYTIAIMFKLADARRIGNLRARYSNHHDVPYNRLLLFDRCPPSMAHMYQSVLERRCGMIEPFNARLTNPYSRSNKRGDLKSLCIGVDSRKLAELHQDLIKDLSSVLRPNFKNHEEDSTRKKRHSVILDRDISAEKTNSMVAKIIAEKPESGLGEVALSGLSLRFVPWQDKSGQSGDRHVDRNRIYYFAGAQAIGRRM